MVYSSYKLQQILYHWLRGHRAPIISRLLRKENLKASCIGIAKFLKKYRETGCIGRRPGSGRPSRITAEIKAIVNEQMRQDDETTATQLHTLLVSRGYRISLRTILQCRISLGWTFRGSSYCQLIRTQNKEKRLAWAQRYRTYKDEDFEEVIFTDECTVQLETHRRFCCRKRGEPPRPKPKYDIHIIIVLYYYFCLYVTSLASTLWEEILIWLHALEFQLMPPLLLHTYTQSQTPSQGTCLCRH